jgi:N-methylhydantoinase A/oxoprolinase/acetone carboxylase beta subunit
MMRDDRSFDNSFGRPMKRIGVDVGGTRTDLVFIDDAAGLRRLAKLPTTAENPSVGTIQGARELCAAAGCRLGATLGAAKAADP